MRIVALVVLLLVRSIPAAAAERPNVVLILVDDLGWTDLGCQGSDLYETPHVDRLAREGTRFTDAYAACTVCSPTRAAVLTGKSPARLHVTDWIHGFEKPFAKLSPPDWTHHLPLEEVTIAEALKEAGYATCHIGKWHLGEREHWPDRQGFDRNLGGCERGAPPSYFSPYRIPTLEDGPRGEYLTDREASEARRFIAEQAQAGRPFLLYLAHYCVHTPLQAKHDVAARYAEKVAAADPRPRHDHEVFAAMVESVDDALAHVRRQLDVSGVADDTMIVFTSDNGGLIHRGRNGDGPTDNHPLRAGKGSPYEGGVRVPLIVLWPGVTKPGSVCDEPVISCDFLPTILAAAGVKSQPADLDGIDLAPVLRDANARLDRDALYWHYPHYHAGGATPYSAIRDGDWKLIEFHEDDRVELYHLAEDLSETTDLAARMPDRAASLRRRLHEWRTSVGAQMPVPNPRFDPDRVDERPPRRRNRSGKP